MIGPLYGVVKKHEAGPFHLVEGRSDSAVCGARWEGNGWAVTMRGLVTAGQAGGVLERLCHNCRRAVAG